MMTSFDTRPSHTRAGLHMATRTRVLVSVNGDDRASFLQGLLCQDVAGQTPGTLRYGFFLSPKARILFDSWIGVLPDRILLSPSLFSKEEEEAFLAHLKKYLFFRTKATLSSETGAFISAALVGPEALALATPLFDPGAEEEGVRRLSEGGFAFLRPGIGAFDADTGGWIDLWLPAEGAGERLKGLEDRVLSRGGQRLDDTGLEVYRVERGVPAVPAELNEGHFPAEAGLDTLAVSYNKGCYVGQEPVTRLKFQGQLSRKLVGIRLDGPIVSEMTLPRHLLASNDNTEAGTLTSLVSSVVCGGPVGLAYVKRGHWDSGEPLVDGKGNRFEVSELPLLPRE